MSTGRYKGSPWPVAAIAFVVVAILAVGILGGFIWHPAVGAGSYPFLPFGFFWIWPLLFGFFFIFFLGRWFFWGWEWRGGYHGHYSDAARILEERYARGEITKDQFEQMTRDLERSRQDSGGA
ncbi:MAG: SHOCT domain-containing protein [Thaumarchaeota archaeon]|nr:SHOCT domain-containing protein [Nitrososphaerota archaeon]